MASSTRFARGCSINIVDDLLSTPREWQHTPEIVLLSFKALADVVRAQSLSIVDLERQLATKVARDEFLAKLNQKANALDIHQTLSHIQASLESRPSYESSAGLEDRVADLQVLVSARPSLDDFRSLIEEKLSVGEWKVEHRDLLSKIGELEVKLASSDYSSIARELQQKVAWEDLEHALENKADKQSVTHALQRKVNRSELESLLVQKTDVQETQNVMAVVEAKADQAWVEELLHGLEPKGPKPFEKQDIEVLTRDFTRSLQSQLHSTTENVAKMKVEIDQVRKTLGAGLSKKADLSEIETIYSLISSKADYEPTMQTIDRIREELHQLEVSLKKEALADRKRIDESVKLRQTLESEFSRLRDQLLNLVEQRNNEGDEIHRYLKTAVTSTRNEILQDVATILETSERLQAEVHALNRVKADRTDLADLDHSLKLVKQSYCSTEEMGSLVESRVADALLEIEKAKQAFEQSLGRVHSQVLANARDTVTLPMLDNLLINKLGVTEANSLLETKANQAELGQLKAKLTELSVSVNRTIDIEEAAKQHRETLQQFEQLKNELVLKANMKDVCALLDMKLNVDEFQRRQGQVQTELDTKFDQQQFDAFNSQYQRIIETLCSENCTGRWIWKSGELKTNNMVPWEIQNANTAPDNFMWEKQKTSILTVAPGLYELCLGVYSRKAPAIQVAVNGDPILSVTGNPKARPHPSGNVTGLTVKEFIALPARARVALVYNGETRGEGFISLRKL